MKVLVVNAGSSSLKYQFIEMDTETVIAKGGIERIGLNGSNIKHVNKVANKDYKIFRELPDHTAAFNLLMECLTSKEMGVISDPTEISAIGHRFVNSGEAFNGPAYVDEEAMKKMMTIINMAPLHNPAHVACIKSCQAILPNVPNVAVFDTAFHGTMPKKASMYGICYEDYEAYKIRKYGFHGTSHKFVSQEAIKYLNRNDLPSEKIVTCHLGNGSSLSAVLNGKCIDTSMGMTPLAGVLMGTRSGDIDASAVAMLAEAKGMSLKETVEYLNKKCGFLGISGVSSDCRDIYTEKNRGNERAGLAVDMFAYTVQKYIGSYAAALNGLDCIVFAGGIGENSWEARRDIMTNMDYLGIKFDFVKNEVEKPAGVFADLSLPNSKVKVLVIPTNEEIVIARETKEIVEGLNK